VRNEVQDRAGVLRRQVPRLHGRREQLWEVRYEVPDRGRLLQWEMH